VTHDELVDRALRWLRGRRCNPIFSDCASCAEIPDAIGWSSSWKMRGSVVVECKASRNDFYADQKKRFQWRHPEWGHRLRASRIGKKEAAKEGWIKEMIPRMGNFRFYMTTPGIITLELLEQHAPNHGLLVVEGRKVVIAKMAPRQEAINHDAEIRYLRFAIINRKTAFDAAPETAATIQDVGG